MAENEQSIKEEMEGNVKEEDFENDDAFEDEDGDNSEDVEDTLKQIHKVKNKMADDEEEESDDDEDSDYDVLGGDMCLYDSRLDEIDELIFMKETVDVLYQQQNQVYMQMASTTDVAELANSLG